ncbi:MAG: DUF192 domain-containing protein [Betaproteobacteria bacterium]|nr:MAG: DUF192 domain-containing protein [Betaproteobacteria bacterium]
MSYFQRYKSSPLRADWSSTGLHRQSRFLATLITLLLLAVSARADPLLTYPLRIGQHSIRAEIADTPETRRRGLMFRTHLADSSGMIFIFPEEHRISMWMKNTLIPLSVAFIDSDGRIVNIEQMQPRSEQTHSSTGPAKFALEMNQGWFGERGIESGDVVTGLDRLPSPR